jgi:hypothetical protein
MAMTVLVIGAALASIAATGVLTWVFWRLNIAREDDPPRGDDGD